MKYNYLIKYAAMLVDETCYIVSKCYLLNAKTIYNENGKKEIEYEVAFPYQKKDNIWKRVPPSFKQDIVYEVFDTYEEALKDVSNKNRELCERTWINLALTDDYHEQVSKKEEDYNNILAKYKVLEQQILDNTLDIDQANVKELNEILKVSKNRIEILSSSLYEFLKFSSYTKYVVYSLPLEQYSKIVELITNSKGKGIPRTLLQASPILYHNPEEEKRIMVLSKNGVVTYYIDDREILIDNDEIIKLDSFDENAKQVYTTETLEDIILSFRKHKCINQSNIEGISLKKSLREKEVKYE